MEYIDLSNPRVVSKWSGTVAYEIDTSLDLNPFIGKSKSSLIQRFDELKDEGSSVKVDLAYQFTGQGVSGMGAMRGREETLQYGTDIVILNELRNAGTVPNRGSIGAHQVKNNLVLDVKESLKSWFNNAVTSGFFNQIAGYNGKEVFTSGSADGRPSQPADGLNFFGLNAVSPPSKNRWVFAGGKKDEKSLTASDTINLRTFDKLKTRAVLMNPKINEIKGLPGGAKYVVFIHPVQTMQLRTNTDAGEWLDITRAIYATKEGNTPIADGSLGVYNQMLFVESRFVPYGVNDDGTANLNVHRAIFCGAQAAALVTGSYDNINYDSLKVSLDFQDYENILGVQAKRLFGLKKIRFSKDGAQAPEKDIDDYAAIVLSSWAPDDYDPDAPVAVEKGK